LAFALAAGAPLLVVPGRALAQADPHAACGSVGWVPREILERPVPLREGVGKLRDPVTTVSPEAQAFYDQGVAYLHSYVWIEAARSFNQALRLDPAMAMAHLGLSRVYTGLDDPAAARAALAKARSLEGSITPKEKRRLAARALQLDAIDDLGSVEKHLAYKKSLDDALAVDLRDAELWLLRGNAEEPRASGRGQRGGAASVAFYQQALALIPDHFAAHHYLIHSYETINQIDLALKHGEVYVRLSAAIPHAHHMYAHDLRRVGRVAEAITEFTAAYDLENAYYASEKIPSEIDWHHPHNLDLLAGCYQHEGRMKTAERLMRESEAIPAVNEYREFNRKEWPVFLLANRRTGEALDAARALTSGKGGGTRVIAHVLAGEALAESGRITEAETELRAAEREVALIPLVTSGVPRTAVEPYVASLQGEVLLRKGHAGEARDLLTGAITRIRAVPGPDAWTEALFKIEAIARLARSTGDFELFEYAALQMKDHDSAYAGTRFALGLVAKRRGDLAGARREFEAAAELWKDADPDLVLSKELRSRLAAVREEPAASPAQAAR
jgi:tetratricopeptide (TPR) repeat protein